MLFAQETTDSLEIGAIVMALFGGLALFLYGMDQMSDALKLVAGDGMKRVLAKLTTNRFTGAIAGDASSKKTLGSSWYGYISRNRFGSATS